LNKKGQRRLLIKDVEVLKGDKTINEIAQEYEVHPKIIGYGEKALKGYEIRFPNQTWATD
jgi:hypothetical protein